MLLIQVANVTSDETNRIFVLSSTSHVKPTWDPGCLKGRQCKQARSLLARLQNHHFYL